jgi:MtN3 and saliva related transmembrane protein
MGLGVNSRPTSKKPMNLLDLTGYVAALCTTGSFVPQVLRVWRTRSTEDISLRMFLILVAGNLL